MGDANKKKGLSGLYVLLILFAIMILFGGPALVRMVNIILFGQCNVAPEATKMKQAIEKVCQGTVGDFEQVDYPSCPVVMSCDDCATASGKVAFRSAVGAAQATQFTKSLAGLVKAPGRAAKTVSNTKRFLADLKYGLSGGSWKSIGGWEEAYKYAKWDANFYRLGMASKSIAELRQEASVLTPTYNLAEYSNWQIVGNAARVALNAAKGRAVSTLLGYSSSTAAVSRLAQRSPATMTYYYIAADPDNLRPDIQMKVDGLTSEVVDNVEALLKGDTTVLPIGLDVYLIASKSQDPAGALQSLATQTNAWMVDAEAHNLGFELNSKLLSLFTSVDDQVYANAAFGQDSCTQPSSSGFNAVPSSFSEVQGACVITNTVVTQEGEDCDQTSPDFSKCASPATVGEQDESVDRSGKVFLRRNHAFRFIDDLRVFLLAKANEIDKKVTDPADKAKVAAAKSDIESTLNDAAEVASSVDDAWYFAYAGTLAVMESVAGLSAIEMGSSKPPETPLIGWYKGVLDSMSSVDELVSGKWSYKQNADGKSVRDAIIEDGLEQKHVKLLKIRNAAYDLLKNGMPDCPKSTRTVSGGTPGEMTMTVPLCSVISSCNYDDKILAQGGGCVLGAPNLEKGRVLVGGVYFSMPAIPVAPLDYGTTIENLQTPVGFVSGLVGGTAGRAIATLGFALQNCPSGGALNPDSSKTLIFCMKPATPVCALPGGCEVCFAANCNTKITCSSVGAANLRVEKKYDDSGETITELTGPVKPI